MTLNVTEPLTYELYEGSEDTSLSYLPVRVLLNTSTHYITTVVHDLELLMVFPWSRLSTGGYPWSPHLTPLYVCDL